jgi:hypothetical protein
MQLWHDVPYVRRGKYWQSHRRWKNLLDCCPLFRCVLGRGMRITAPSPDCGSATGSGQWPQWGNSSHSRDRDRSGTSIQSRDLGRTAAGLHRPAPGWRLRARQAAPCAQGAPCWPSTTPSRQLQGAGKPDTREATGRSRPQTSGTGSGCCDPAPSQHDATLLVHCVHGRRQMTATRRPVMGSVVTIGSVRVIHPLSQLGSGQGI